MQVYQLCCFRKRILTKRLQSDDEDEETQYVLYDATVTDVRDKTSPELNTKPEQQEVYYTSVKKQHFVIGQ